MSIRLGILGFAHGHVGTYCGQWLKLPRDQVEVVAGWDHDPARAANAAEKLGLAVASSADALLGRDDIDAVVIGVETSLHADLVEQAAAAGKSIVLQKPLALTLDQADRIVTAVERAGVRFTLAWQMRVDPQNQKMKELLNGGTLGRVVMVRRRHGLATHTWPDFDKSWHADPKLNRGMWADDACHAIDFLYWLLGKPESVSAEIATLLNPRVPDDQGIAIFRYANGTLAEVGSSFTCVAGENTTEITCERGVIIQNYGDAVSCGVPRPATAPGLKWYTAESRDWIDSGIASPPSHGDRIAALAPEILAFLQGRRPAIATAAEGRDVLAMTLASYQSSAEGRRINL